MLLFFRPHGSGSGAVVPAERLSFTATIRQRLITTAAIARRFAFTATIRRRLSFPLER